MNDVSEESSNGNQRNPPRPDRHRLLALVQEAALAPVSIEVSTEPLAHSVNSIKIDLSVIPRRKS